MGKGQFCDEGYRAPNMYQPNVCFNFKTGKVKKRPCLDLSRHVNKYIMDTPVNISHLSAVEDMLLEGDFQTLYDLNNMYFQVKVTQKQQQFENPSTGEFHFVLFNVDVL